MDCPRVRWNSSRCCCAGVVLSGCSSAQARSRSESWRTRSRMVSNTRTTSPVTTSPRRMGAAFKRPTSLRRAEVHRDLDLHVPDVGALPEGVADPRLHLLVRGQDALPQLL